jgi:hypothetical protein
MPSDASREAEIAARLTRLWQIAMDAAREVIYRRDEAKMTCDEEAAQPIYDALLYALRQEQARQEQRAEAALQQTREALATFGEHKWNCDTIDPLQKAACTCGLDAALKAVR